MKNLDENASLLFNVLNNIVAKGGYSSKYLLKKGKLLITRISSIQVLDTAILAYHEVQTMAASYSSPKGKAQPEMVGTKLNTIT